MRSRRGLFAAVAAACTLGVIAVVVIAALGGRGGAAATLSASGGSRGEEMRQLDPRLRLVVRAVDRRDPRLNGHLYRAAPTGRAARAGGDIACVRVAVGGGRGICLYLAATGVDYRAALLDRRFRVRKVLGLPGLPSRARVSPGGRFGAITTFATGDSYASPGTFSTRTLIIDMRRGRIVADLEDWRFTRGGNPVTAVDRNFWGVTFGAGEDQFYATMATGEHHYLVRGSIRGRGGAVVRDDVECPSLSPDGSRIAYKHPLGKGRWRLHVYDLRSGADIALAEPRSIDDQAAWIDDRHVSYAYGHDTWVTPSGGGGGPEILIRNADSATVQARPRS